MKLLKHFWSEHCHTTWWDTKVHPKKYLTDHSTPVLQVQGLQAEKSSAGLFHWQLSQHLPLQMCQAGQGWIVCHKLFCPILLWQSHWQGSGGYWGTLFPYLVITTCCLTEKIVDVRWPLSSSFTYLFRNNWTGISQVSLGHKQKDIEIQIWLPF